MTTTAMATSPPFPLVVQLSNGNSNDGDGSNGDNGDVVAAMTAAAQMLVGNDNIQQSTKHGGGWQRKQR